MKGLACGYYRPSGSPSFAPPVILVYPYTTMQYCSSPLSFSPLGIPIYISAHGHCKRLGVMLAGHARVSRLITEDSKVRATMKDD